MEFWIQRSRTKRPTLYLRQSPLVLLRAQCNILGKKCRRIVSLEGVKQHTETKHYPCIGFRGKTNDSATSGYYELGFRKLKCLNLTVCLDSETEGCARYILKRSAQGGPQHYQR